jgi:hypothetical protein
MLVPRDLQAAGSGLNEGEMISKPPYLSRKVKRKESSGPLAPSMKSSDASKELIPLGVVLELATMK